MKHVTLLTLLVFAAPFGWGETWVCDVKTYRDGKETKSSLMKYSVEGDLLRYFDGLLTMELVSNDETALLAVDPPDDKLSAGSPRFSYVFLDKVNKFVYHGGVSNWGDYS